MTFNELLDIRPNINLATYIQLWLLGGDDKIYIDIKIGNDYVLEDVRIIDTRLIKYYEYEIEYFEGGNYETYTDMCVALRRKEE